MVRQRLARADRFDQLVSEAWALVRSEGTDALTLGRLAERAGVTKPVVYSHFPSRPALLAALFTEFDDRQTTMLQQYLDAAEESLDGRAHAIADSYIGCALAQGRELTGVLAALQGSPELERVKRAADDAYAGTCRQLLAPYTPTKTVARSSLTAIFGAADALAQAAVSGDLSPEQARAELATLVVAVVGRA